MPNICLNMIVKNEAHILNRLFQSVKDVINYYVIVDTGSSDNTIEFIFKWMSAAGIEGEIYSHNWVNFAVNRNQALRYAIDSKKADWVLLIDADEQLIYKDPTIFHNLEPQISYSIEKKYGDIKYSIPSLIYINNEQWSWTGVVHEYIHNPNPCKIELLPDVYIKVEANQGARSLNISTQEKFRADAQLLKQQLNNNPTDTRSQFYLAQSYRDAGDFDLAYENYQRRVLMGGWVEEVFISKCNMGKLAIILKKSHNEIISILLDAYETCPARGSEPLYYLAKYCRHNKLWGQAYLFAKMGSFIPYPQNYKLFIEHEIYHWKILDELSIAAYWNGKYVESIEICTNLLKLSICAQHHTRIQSNLNFSLQKLSHFK